MKLCKKYFKEQFEKKYFFNNNFQNLLYDYVYASLN